MKRYKNRTIDPTRPVRVYRNLHKDCFSVVQHGLVVAHVGQLCLRDVRPIVSELGRQKVLQLQRKHVHAWLEGYIANEPMPHEAEEFTYNPYEKGSFYLKGDGSDVLTACHVWLAYPKCFL